MARLKRAAPKALRARKRAPRRKAPRDDSSLSLGYREYLESVEWKEKRDKAVKAAGGRCQVCNSRIRLDVHHRTYRRIFKEEIGDLVVLCRRCHTVFHENGRLR